MKPSLPLTLLTLGLTSLAFAGLSDKYVAVSATFTAPAKPGAQASVSVTLTPQEPGIVVNENPAPRLALDPTQKILVDKQAPKSAAPPPDPAHAKYLDPLVPIEFPVALRAGAAKGVHTVAATVTFFYCSKRESWCRKGTTDVSFDVRVP
jgi:hypothetical protein